MANEATPFEASKLAQRHIELACTARADALSIIRASLMIRFGVEPGPSGLTPDVVKFHPDYRAAKAIYDRAFKELQDCNQQHVRKFKKEIREERRKR